MVCYKNVTEAGLFTHNCIILAHILVQSLGCPAKQCFVKYLERYALVLDQYHNFEIMGKYEYYSSINFEISGSMNIIIGFLILILVEYKYNANKLIVRQIDTISIWY